MKFTFGGVPVASPWQLPAPLCVHLVKTLLLPRGLVEKNQCQYRLEHIDGKNQKILVKASLLLRGLVGKNIANKHCKHW